MTDNATKRMREKHQKKALGDLEFESMFVNENGKTLSKNFSKNKRKKKISKLSRKKNRKK